MDLNKKLATRREWQTRFNCRKGKIQPYAFVQTICRSELNRWREKSKDYMRWKSISTCPYLLLFRFFVCHIFVCVGSHFTNEGFNDFPSHTTTFKQWEQVDESIFFTREQQTGSFIKKFFCRSWWSNTQFLLDHIPFCPIKICVHWATISWKRV